MSYAIRIDGRGWRAVGGNADLQDGEVLSETPPALPDHVVPSAVTRRQARLALYNAGLLDQVDAAVDLMGPTAKIEWDSASAVERDSALVSALAAGLRLSSADLDALFINAATL